MGRSEKRPLPTFRIPEGDVTSLRKVYESDEWNGRKGYKEILEEAFEDFRKKNPKEQLPDTFKDLLAEGDKAHPAKVYVGIITCANYILEDTICAEALIDRIDTGNYQKKNPALPKGITNRDINNFFMDYGLSKAPKVLSDMSVIKKKGGNLKDKIAEVKLDSEMFINPGGTAEDMIAVAETEEEKKIALSLYKDLTEAGFKDLAKTIAAETGGKASDIINPKKRTPEQYDHLRRAVRKKISSRMEAVYKSKFMQAIRDIQHTTTVSKLSSATVSIIMNYAALYFFAIHPEINLRGKGEMDPKHREEVIRIYEQLMKFMEKERQAANRKKEFLSDWDAFMRFVETEHPEKKSEIGAAVRITAREVREAHFEVDKLSSHIWRDPSFSKPSMGENVQLSLGFSFEDHRDTLPAVNTAKQKDKAKGKDALVVWGLRFGDLPDNMKISRELTPYDRFVHDAVLSLYRAGANEVTLNYIYKAMGRKGTPSKDDRDKINASLTKMRAAIIYVDNTNEKAVNTKYPQFKYDGALLPFERIKVIIKGKETETAIRILAEPPMGRFARERGQCTAFPLSVWSFPLSLTNAKIQLAQYVAEYIVHVKNNKKLSRKLLFETIFKNCGFDTRLKKSRGREDLQRLVDYWRDECEPPFIGKKSKIETDGVVFDL